MGDSKEFIHVKSISELHRILGIGKPKHPTISLIHSTDVNWSGDFYNKNYILNFYMISLKYHNSDFIYGRNHYDFEEGTMVFTSPGQVIKSQTPVTQGMDKGWMLYIHPDLVRNTNLSNRIDEYTFFSYAINEALHLSEDEKLKIYSIATDIEKEYSQNIDKHSHTLIVSNLELLLNHCTRFYDRQFYTRSHHQKGIVIEIEKYLRDYFNSEEQLEKGLPNVKQCADQVGLSPNYLSDLLKKETGKNTQEHIHFYLIEKAKNLLLGSNAAVSQIAFELGFEYPQYFGNLFKKKTGLTPTQYREKN